MEVTVSCADCGEVLLEPVPIKEALEALPGLDHRCVPSEARKLLSVERKEQYVILPIVDPLDS